MNPNPVAESTLSRPRTGASGRLRWWIVWVLFLSTVINYVSRQTFSILAPVITAKFHLNHTDLAAILGSFQISYALTWLVGGIILDAVGTRIGLALAVVFWSVVNMLTGLANSVFGFAAFRFLLGIGEGFNWPGASKTVAEWFPSQERSLAVAIFDSGSSVGGALAALILPLVALVFGWRATFVFPGLLGFLWLAVWLHLYFPIGNHPQVSPAEVEYIRAGQDAPAVSARGGVGRWLDLARNRNVWGIVVGRAFTDPIGWFYVFWLPQYLSDARGFSLQRIAEFAWLPFVASDLGNFTGGWISGYCIRRGMPVVRARLWVCIFSCLPMLAGIPAATVHSSYSALALICMAMWGFASWSTMGLTFPSDLLPQDVVATVTGLSGLAAGLMGAAFTFSVGVIVDRISYRPVFLVAGIMPVFATICVLLFIRKPEAAPRQQST